MMRIFRDPETAQKYKDTHNGSKKDKLHVWAKSTAKTEIPKRLVARQKQFDSTTNPPPGKRHYHTRPGSMKTNHGRT